MTLLEFGLVMLLLMASWGWTAYVAYRQGYIQGWSEKTSQQRYYPNWKPRWTPRDDV